MFHFHDIGSIDSHSILTQIDHRSNSVSYSKIIYLLNYGSLQMNIDIIGALFTLIFSLLNSQCKEGAKYVNVHLRTRNIFSTTSSYNK